MYCGEVNVNQAVLSTFISTAEALQIKGLTENNDPNSTTNLMSLAPTHEPTEATSSPFTIVHSQSLSFDHQTTSNNSVNDTSVVDQQNKNPKRVTLISVQTASKRQKFDSEQCVSSKSGESIGTEQSSSSSIRAELRAKLKANLTKKNSTNDQTASKPDATLPIKSEPNYHNDEVGETSQVGAIKVEDRIFDDMNVSIKDVEITEDVSMTDDPQSHSENTQHKVKFIAGKTNKILVVDGHKFYKTKVYKSCTLWICRCKKPLGCNAKCRTSLDDRNIRFLDLNHNHGTKTLSKESTSTKPAKFSRAHNSI